MIFTIGQLARKLPTYINRIPGEKGQSIHKIKVEKKIGFLGFFICKIAFYYECWNSWQNYIGNS